MKGGHMVKLKKSTKSLHPNVQYSTLYSTQQGGHWSVGQISTYEMANYPENEENMESDSAILMNNKNSQALYLYLELLYIQYNATLLCF